MANGDAAAADGMDLVASVDDRRNGWDEINKSRDYIVRLKNWVITQLAAKLTKTTTEYNNDFAYRDVLIAEAKTIGLTAQSSANTALAGFLSAVIYGRGVSGSWRSLAVQSDGTLAHTASARRFKKNIAPREITDEQLQALTLVTFAWKESGMQDFGVIAEDLDNAGLSEFTFRDDDGQILGVHYERVALAMLPVVQRLITRVTELENRK